MSVPEPAGGEPRTDGTPLPSVPQHASPGASPPVRPGPTHSAPAPDLRGRYEAFRRRTAAATARLTEVYTDLPDQPQLSNAQRWLFDNDYLLWRSLSSVAADMPLRFFARLRSQPDGTPRVEAVVRAYLADHEGRVAVTELRRYLQDQLATAPLDLAELWAVPTFVRLNLVERLLAYVDDESVVASAVLGLHDAQRTDWTRFVEATSVVEERLGADPAGVYAAMDDGTRDRYRGAVERLARRAGVSESTVCDAVIAVASRDGSGHVGTYLVGHLQHELEDRLGFTPGPGLRLRRAAIRLAPVLYVLALAVVGAIIATPLVAYARASGSGWGFWLLALALVVPVWLAAEVIVQRVAAAVVPPRVLPKLDLLRSAGEEHRTLVAIPCLLNDTRTIDALFERLERHHVASAVGPLAEKLSFALLADLPDAPTETTGSDSGLLEHANELLDELRSRNPSGDFHLLVRRRLFNESEGVWMGWERKRGKLMELNALLLEGANGTFTTNGLPAGLAGVRYVITLDADSLLPPGAAAALIGTLSHPVNRARFDRGGRVVGGYTVLQPRVEVAPGSADRTRFSRMFSGSRGLDLYSLAVSDTYMDLFGEGLYAGKGIYDVAAFDGSLRGAVPENAILSHDLFEGGRGRAGLVSDVVIFEGTPTSFLAYLQRQQRWTRGDWQLLPFLRGGGLSWVARWAAAQNLVRSLAPLAFLLALVVAYLAPPGGVTPWVVVTVMLFGAPYLMGMLNSINATRGADGRDTVGFGGVLVEVQRWAFELVVLPVNAAAAAAAIAVTLRRVYVTHRHLLQWRGAAREAVDAENMNGMLGWWRDMAVAPVTALAAAVLLGAFRPQALYPSLPILIGWAAAPFIAWVLSRPLRRRSRPLTTSQQRTVRALARRTWLYFERFVGPEDRWLPPDHFQESPRGAVAHRTSPTNIGLLLTSTHGAYDLGFLGMRSLVGRLSATFATMAVMETYRGHLLNWYDTKTLQPLAPRYVSTVDSGNLHACLVAVKGGCLELGAESVNRWQSFEGLLTLLDLYEESAKRLPRDVTALRKRIALTVKQVEDAATDPRRWPGLLEDLEGQWLPRLDDLLLDAVRRAGTDSDHGLLTEIAVWSGRLHRHVQEAIRDVTTFMPWVAPAHAAVAATFADLEPAPSYDDLPRLYDVIAGRLAGVGTGTGPAADSAAGALLGAVAGA
ncbi:MAG TPA: glycosyltransferase family 2 protein, partial [Trueperaceae bacterium]|nr:glycosyltransferase family 2 protein [Trueperaceae bacterium]